MCSARCVVLLSCIQWVVVSLWMVLADSAGGALTAARITMSRSFLVDSLISRPAGPGPSAVAPSPFPLPPSLWGLPGLQGLHGLQGFQGLPSVGALPPRLPPGLQGLQGLYAMGAAGPPPTLSGVLRPVPARPSLSHPLSPSGE